MACVRRRISELVFITFFFQLFMVCFSLFWLNVCVCVCVRYCCVVILNIEPILKQKQNDDKGVTYLSVSAVSFFLEVFV